MVVVVSDDPAELVEVPDRVCGQVIAHALLVMRDSDSVGDVPFLQFGQ
jgi:hypothetical protein